MRSSRLLFLACVIAISWTVFAHERYDDPPAGWTNVNARNADLSERMAWHAARRRPRPTVSELIGNATSNRCETCEKIVVIVDTLFTNKTSFAVIDAIANDLCAELFRNDTGAAEICKQIPILVEKLVTYGEASNANIPNVVCADFLHMCVQPCCKNATAPEQIHLSFASLSLAGESVDYRVGWTTLTQVADARVRFRIGSSQWWESNATQRTYDVGGWVGTLNFAVMHNLSPGVTYTYQVGSPSTFWSREYQFTTLTRAAGSSVIPLRVLGVADMGFGPAAQATIDAMTKLVDRGEVDFIMHPGDIGYADADQSWWDEFMRLLEPIAARVPYMTGPGNHECIWYNCTAYKARFFMPPAGIGAPDDAMYYALHVPTAQISFVMLNTETWYDTADVDSTQRAWLQQALDASQPFKFVMHHRPLYCLATSVDCNAFAQRLRDQLEATYRSNGVAAVMCGHIHNFERTYPVYNGTVVSTSYTDASAPVYFVNGGAGNREGQAPFSGPLYAWTAFKTLERTFMRYSIAATPGGVNMTAQTIRSSTLEVIDQISVIRHVGNKEGSVMP